MAKPDDIGKYCYFDGGVYIIEGLKLDTKPSHALGRTYVEASFRLRSIKTNAIRTTRELAKVRILEGEADSIDLQTLRTLYG